eukprot:761788-Hanusia_phi.AAC.2
MADSRSATQIAPHMHRPSVNILLSGGELRKVLPDCRADISICGFASLHISDPRRFDEIPAEQEEEWGNGVIKCGAFRYGQHYVIAFHLLQEDELIRAEICSLSPLREVGSIWRGVPSDVSILSSAANAVKDFVISDEYQQFLDFMKGKQDDYGFFFSGYSLGGLVSQLIMLHAVETFLPQRNLSCITFGKPLPGSIEFARYFNNRIRFCSNFVAKGDNILDFFKSKCKNELGTSQFHEDAEAIVLDNDEVLEPSQSDDQLTAHDPNYYSRCCTNLYRRKKQIPNLSTDRRSAGLKIVHFLRAQYCNSLMYHVLRVRRTKIISPWMLEVGFELLAARLREKWVITGMKKTLETFLYLITRAKIRAKLPSDGELHEDSERPNVRVFLAAFMIDARPSNCFESIGHLERQVQESAAQL